MEIGKRIQRLRRERSLTQEQLAAALGVTSAAVSKWETNAAIPDVAIVALRTSCENLAHNLQKRKSV